MTMPSPISSRLVIGTSSLLGPRSPAQALSLLEVAYESGITHVDTARAYSSGDAEAVVGAFMLRHPGEITVTTKFGISPVGAVGRSRAVRGLARRLMRFSPRIRRVLGRASARLAYNGRFDVASARASIETSMRALDVERIDVLLLHDASEADCSDELLEFLLTLRGSGAIGAFGVGTRVGDARVIAQSRPDFAGVLQFPYDLAAPVSEPLLVREEGTTVIHGAFSPLAGLAARLQSDLELCRQWSASLDVDVLGRGVLSGLLLACAVADNSSGPVLFSTTREDRITENAAALDGPLADPDRLRRFRGLATTLRLP